MQRLVDVARGTASIRRDLPTDSGGAANAPAVASTPTGAGGAQQGQPPLAFPTFGLLNAPHLHTPPREAIAALQHQPGAPAVGVAGAGPPAAAGAAAASGGQPSKHTADGTTAPRRHRSRHAATTGAESAASAASASAALPPWFPTTSPSFSYQLPFTQSHSTLREHILAQFAAALVPDFCAGSAPLDRDEMATTGGVPSWSLGEELLLLDAANALMMHSPAGALGVDCDLAALIVAPTLTPAQVRTAPSRPNVHSRCPPCAHTHQPLA